MQTSQFHVYSIGIVAENKAMSSHVVEVVPIEILPFLDGELNEEREPIESKGETATGEHYQVKVDASNAIEAKWLQMGSNRLTPPDVRRGERVLLWQFADADQYYWTTLGMDDNLRKLETVVYSWSATTDESDTVQTPENTYSLEISTHSKHVTFRTAQANGEPFVYTLQFDTDEGRVVLTDDIDNYIELESELHRITLKNTDGSHVTLDAEDIRFEAIRDLIGVVGRNVEVSVGGNVNFDIGGDKTVTVGGNISESAGGSITLTAPGGTTIDSPNTTVTGSVDTKGDTSIGGTLDVSGKASIGGDLDIGGNVSWSGVATGDGSGIRDTIPVD